MGTAVIPQTFAPNPPRAVDTRGFLPAAATREIRVHGFRSERIDAKASAAFIVASLEGSAAMVKKAQGTDILRSRGKHLVRHLHSVSKHTGSEGRE